MKTKKSQCFFFYEIGNVPWSRMVFLHLSYSNHKIALKHQNFTVLTIVNIILYFWTSKRPCDITRSSNLCLSAREVISLRLGFRRNFLSVLHPNLVSSPIKGILEILNLTTRCIPMDILARTDCVRSSAGKIS